MGFKVGGGQPAPIEPDDIDEGELTAGEDLYAVLLAALSGATDAEQMQIASAFASKTPWEELSQELRDLFDGAGEAFEEVILDESPDDAA